MSKAQHSRPNSQAWSHDDGEKMGDRGTGAVRGNYDGWREDGPKECDFLLSEVAGSWRLRGRYESLRNKLAPKMQADIGTPMRHNDFGKTGSSSPGHVTLASIASARVRRLERSGRS